MKGFALLAACGLSACITTPLPPPTIAPATATGPFPALPVATITPVPDDWWRLYDDPALDALVRASLAANADLRVAYANLDGARAALRQAQAARLPQTTVEGGLTVDGTAAQPSASSNVPTTDYDLALTASWDADLFGRLRSSALAAHADAEAQAAAVDGLRVAVVADTVLAWVDLCGATQALAVALVRDQLAAGEVSPLEVSQAASLAETTRATLAPFAAAQANARYRLATLQGRPPAEARTTIVTCTRPPMLRAAAPVGDGQALLLRRPDIREAERRLAAAAARIGVARADLYPRVNLGGAIGLLTGRFAATATPLVSWAFPNQAPARARLAQARATERAALAGWDVAVLRGLREVETALAAYDADTGRFIGKGLTELGHQIVVSGDGRDGLFHATEGGFGALIVDRMLPGLDGLSLVKALRAAGDRTPVLMLTAIGGLSDRVEGIEGGADDYLVKPFAFSELAARVQALGRRQAVAVEPATLTVGDITLDLHRRTVTRAGRRVTLQPREFALLAELMRNPRRIMTRTMLLERVWDFDFDPKTNIVETHLSRLRTKLNAGFDDDAIETVRGAGYMIRGG